MAYRKALASHKGLERSTLQAALVDDGHIPHCEAYLIEREAEARHGILTRAPVTSVWCGEEGGGEICHKVAREDGRHAPAHVNPNHISQAKLPRTPLFVTL